MIERCYLRGPHQTKSDFFQRCTDPCHSPKRGREVDVEKLPAKTEPGNLPYSTDAGRLLERGCALRRPGTRGLSTSPIFADVEWKRKLDPASPSFRWLRSNPGMTRRFSPSTRGLGICSNRGNAWRLSGRPKLHAKARTRPRELKVLLSFDHRGLLHCTLHPWCAA
jgi:hypothetical protein